MGKNLSCFMLTTVMVLGVFAMPAMAVEGEQSLEPEFSQITAVISVEDIETGEIQHFYEEIESAVIEQAQSLTRNGETYTSFTAGVVVDFDLSGDTPDIAIAPRFNDGPGSITIERGVRAEVLIACNKRVQGGFDQINVTRFYGSWQPSSNMYIVSNRSAKLTIMPSARILNLAPTSNSFSSTAPASWGWLNEGRNSKASSEATISVTGMGGTHRIVVNLIIN